MTTDRMVVATVTAIATIIPGPSRLEDPLPSWCFRGTPAARSLAAVRSDAWLGGGASQYRGCAAAAATQWESCECFLIILF